MKCATVLLVVAAVACLVEGKKYVWVGSNNDMSNCDNFGEGPCVVGGTPVSTDLTSADELTLSVKADTDYNVGRKVVFASKQKIVLGNNIKWRMNAPPLANRRDLVDGIAKFAIPASGDRSRNIACPSNWNIESNNVLRDSDNTVPCSYDSIRFPEYATPELGDGKFIVDTVVMAGETLNQADFCELMNVADCQAQVAIGEEDDTAKCAEFNFLFEGDCNCVELRPQCYDLTNPDDAADFQETKDEIKERDQIAQREEDSLREEIITREYELKIDSEAFVPDPIATKDDFQKFVTASLEDLKETFRETVATNLPTPITQVGMPEITIEDDGSKITVVFNVEANVTKGSVAGPDASVEELKNLEDSGTISWTAGDTNALVTATKDVLSDAVGEQQKEATKKEIIELTDAHDNDPDVQACGDACSSDNINNVADDVTKNFDDPATLISDLKDCITDNTNDTIAQTACKDAVIQQAIDDGEVPKDATPEDLKKIGDDLLDVIKGEESTGTTLLTDLVDKKETIEKVEDLQNIVIVQTAQSPVLTVGGALDNANKVHVINLLSKYQDTLKTKIVGGGYNILAVRDFKLWMPTDNRRRNVDTALYIQFYYDVMCDTSANPNGCNPFADPAYQNNVIGTIDGVLVLFSVDDFASEICLDTTTGQTDVECCKARAATTYAQFTANGATDAAATAAAADAVKKCLACGTQPALADGTCPGGSQGVLPNVDELASESAAAASASAAAATSTEASSKDETSDKSSGGGLPIPIIAGAAGGCILIIAIIAFIMYKRGGNSGRTAHSASDDRNVVAFENPMYDDPTSQGMMQQPIYDNDASKEDEGLYDEPAFNQTAEKANPLYESTEDLTGGDMGDGYLDGMEDTGYLDVAPDM